jgi:outer membrane protein TolC
VADWLVWRLVAGCAVGPNYKRPAGRFARVFRDDNAPTNTSFADLDWWQVYQDDTLQALIREALTNNYDLRIAVTRVEQARAGRHAGQVAVRSQRELQRRGQPRAQ